MVDTQRPDEVNPWLTDAVIVLALLGAAVLGANLADPDGVRPTDVWIAVAVSAVSCLALFAARSRPRTTVVITGACAVILGMIGYVLTPMLLAPNMVALYWLAARVPPRTAWIFGGITTALVVGAAVGVDNLDRTVLLRIVGPALWLLLPLALGSRSRIRHAYIDAVQSRADHAERTREDEARLRVTEERMRIARDLHDVVAHHMAVANAQVGAAAHLLDSDPALTKRILAELQVTTSSVMLDMRDTVGVLRRAVGADGEDLSPAPGLAQLPDLVRTVAAGGLAVDVQVEGRSRELPAGVDLTAYRIIQEALTNATKYASSATAVVRLGYDRTRLTIGVTNATTEQPDELSEAAGFGVVGMRERAESVGGTLRVGRGAGGVFEVVTSLPIPVPMQAATTGGTT